MEILLIEMVFKSHSFSDIALIEPKVCGIQ
jgi:hypothetical protein